MKKLSLIMAVSAVALILSCTAPHDSSSEAKKNKEKMASVYRGIESGDMSKFSEAATDDIVDHTSMGDVKGIENVKKMLADMHNHITDLKFEEIAYATSENGDYQFCLVKVTGTAADNSMGMAPGTKLEQIAVDVVKLKDGKATEHWEYVDAKYMADMMKSHISTPTEQVMATDTSKMSDKTDTTKKY
jgi:ketosteroid isomerase-like protein